ncbi:MAG: single-stranded-DNA-specific exonuclease RecJ [Clostridia bacterium]|nr:single-stranded-DNA-specific exonuclease RecJ [Clostridia bacterium]
MKKDKLLEDKRLINWLNNKGIITQEDMREFLYPSFSSLNNPFLFKNMNKVVQTIKNGINKNKKFVIVGDYDCDGISSSTLFYKYFESQNAKCDVYIPNRFEDGYGLNMHLIDEILEKSNPDILITVDLGISCINEIDYLNSKGVVVIVTDHHEPQETLPNCLIIDPKVNTEYPFSHLCGAGVVFKIVSALAGHEFANSFIDLVAIATIGDIVPLLGENRAISKLGMEKLAKKDFSLLGLKLLFNQLKIENPQSSDIYLKIVPRINSSGRMDNAKKVFDYFVCSDENVCLKLLAEILADNELRLTEISRCYSEIEKELEKLNIIDLPLICVKGNFHEGVLGILASKITTTYNKPAIVFSKTATSSYKGSGRSVADINLHGVIMNFKDLCLHFGGHKMALGLEISEDKIDEFINKLTVFCKNAPEFNSVNLLPSTKADIIIDFKDINANFIGELNLLAPFGCENSKPILAIKTNSQLNFAVLGKKGAGHIKLVNEANANVVYFGGEKHKNILLSNGEKEIFLDLDFTEFKNKKYPQGVVKQVKLLSAKSYFNNEEYLVNRIFNFCLGLCTKEAQNLDNIFKIQNIEEFLIKAKDSAFGNLILACTPSSQDLLKNINLNNFTIVDEPPQSLQNAVLVSNNSLCDLGYKIGYKNILVLDNLSEEELLRLSEKSNVFYLKTQIFNKAYLSGVNIRQLCANVYTQIAGNMISKSFSSWQELIANLKSSIPNYSEEQIAISVMALYELKIIDIIFASPSFISITLCGSSKKDLSLSKVLTYFGE